MNQNQNPTTEQVIKDLAEYAAAQAELQQAKTFGHTPIEGPDKGHNRRLEAAQRRLDAIPIPDRATAEAALLAEIQSLAAELDRLKGAFKSAGFDELEAVQKRDAANQNVNYQQRFSILGLDPIKAAHAAHAAQENLNKVIYAREVIEGQLDRIHERMVKEFGTTSRGHFPAAAARRVDNLLGPIYDQQHVTDLKTKFGLTDKMLNRMATTQ